MCHSTLRRVRFVGPVASHDHHPHPGLPREAEALYVNALQICERHADPRSTPVPMASHTQPSPPARSNSAGHPHPAAPALPPPCRAVKHIQKKLDELRESLITFPGLDPAAPPPLFPDATFVSD